MIRVILVLIAVFCTSCEIKQDTQTKNTETTKQIPSEVKFIDAKGVCKLLSGFELDQGNFRLVESEAYSGHYECDAFEMRKLTCSSSGGICSELQYTADGSKRGVTEISLKYRNYAGADKNIENTKDTQIFINAANVLTKATLRVELDDLAKKQILETLIVQVPNGKDIKAGGSVYEKKFDRAILSIFRNVNSYGTARIVELTIFADEYWKDDKNTFLEWGCRSDTSCN